MHKKLIYDLGFHIGQDTDYYLSQGYDVIAVEADPALIQKAKIKYQDVIENGRLKLVHCAIHDSDRKDIEFNVSTLKDFNSINPEFASKMGNEITSVVVKTRTLASIMKEHGVPYYCKIDIEGYDGVALESLNSLTELPPYISAESECASEEHRVTDEEALEILTCLADLGYKKFKLVDQNSFKILPEEKKYYYELSQIKHEFLSTFPLPIGNKYRLIKKFGFRFSAGGAGPFGEDLDGNWVSYSQATQLITRHRKDYFRLKRARNYGFWCDWHAKM